MSRSAVPTDAQWALIAPVLPSPAGRAGRPSRDDRRVLEGIIYRYRCGLAWWDVPAEFLATLLIESARQLPLRRLEAIYDHVYIDEVQDLGGYDLEILDALLRSTTPLTMVGDVRQAVLATSPSERKHKQYKNLQVWNWFRNQEKAGRLVITHRATTWRCRPEIAAFADSLFASAWEYPSTVSLNASTTHHDGVFLVRTEDLDAYIEEFAPQNLRWSAASWRVPIT